MQWAVSAVLWKENAIFGYEWNCKTGDVSRKAQKENQGLSPVFAGSSAPRRPPEYSELTLFADVPPGLH